MAEGSEVLKPLTIGAEICARLGFDPSSTKEITIRLSYGKAEVHVEAVRLLTDLDSELIGATLKRYRLIEITD